jgi:hypothetical protein
MGDSNTPASCKVEEIYAGKQEAEPDTDASAERIGRMYKEYTGWPNKMPDREGNSMTGKKL